MTQARTIGLALAAGFGFALAASGGCGGKADPMAARSGTTLAELAACSVSPALVAEDAEAVILDNGYDPQWTIRVEVADAVGKTTIDLNPEADGSVRVPYLTEAKGSATVRIGRIHNGRIELHSKCKFEVMSMGEAQPASAGPGEDPSISS